MSNSIRVGIIGAGNIAQSVHIPGYRAQEGVEVVSICDILPGRAAEVASRHGIPRSYDSYEEMLAAEDLDAVSVCTPNFAHAAATVAALRAGVNVLCEKPMAMCVAEGKEMVAAARESGRLLQIGLNWRFTTEAQTLKRFIEAGELGDIYYGEATCLRRRGVPSWGVFTRKDLQGGGALIDIGVHTLDHTMWLMGCPRPVAVMGATYTAFGKREGIFNPWGPWDPTRFDVDDMGVALIRFDNGATLMLKAAWAAHIEKTTTETRILGTEGGACMSPLHIYKDMHQTMVDITPVQLTEVKSHTKEIEHFIGCIRGEHTCIVDAEQVLYVQAVLDAIYASSQTGREVCIDL
ncbi:MAG TPA: Gfo/Idh/MocA family oxidoreductase [Chloroflexi bacterium]|jgi:predicted dehydrogenase|nr:Gfo/Idh/MocA family oxidoreductase [Chloroflexota bacterium]